MQATSTEFRVDALNTERSFVLKLRAESEKRNNNNKFKWCAAFSIFRVAQVVASFCPLPPFELKDELLEAFKEYLRLEGKQSQEEELLEAFEEYDKEGKVLTAADRYALSRVTRIGDDFLSRCPDLTTIDLSPLSNLTTVGDRFLSECSGFKTIDLSSLSKLTTVGNGFLAFCSSLSTIDLSPLSNVTNVGNGFLCRCIGLTTIDLSPLSNVTTVGDEFLSHCSRTVQGKRFLSS